MLKKFKILFLVVSFLGSSVSGAGSSSDSEGAEERSVVHPPADLANALSSSDDEVGSSAAAPSGSSSTEQAPKKKKRKTKQQKKKAKQERARQNLQEHLSEGASGSGRGSSSPTIYDFLFRYPEEGEAFCQLSALPRSDDPEEEFIRQLLVMAWEVLLKGNRDPFPLTSPEGNTIRVIFSAPTLRKKSSKLDELWTTNARLIELYNMVTRLGQDGISEREVLSEKSRCIIRVCTKFPYLDNLIRIYPKRRDERAGWTLFDLICFAFLNYSHAISFISSEDNPRREQCLFEVLEKLQKLNLEAFHYAYLQALKLPWVNHTLEGGTLPPPRTPERRAYIIRKGFEFGSALSKGYVCIDLVDTPGISNPYTGIPFPSPWAKANFCVPCLVDRINHKRRDGTCAMSINRLGILWKGYNLKMLSKNRVIAPFLARSLWKNAGHPGLRRFLSQIIDILQFGPDGSPADVAFLREEVFKLYPPHTPANYEDDPLNAEGIGHLYLQGLGLKYDEKGNVCPVANDEERFSLAQQYLELGDPEYRDQSLAHAYLYILQFRPEMVKEEREREARRLFVERKDYVSYLKSILDKTLSLAPDGTSITTPEERIQAAEACIALIKDGDEAILARRLFCQSAIDFRMESLETQPGERTLEDYRAVLAWGEELLHWIAEEEGEFTRGDLALATKTRTLLADIRGQFEEDSEEIMEESSSEDEAPPAPDVFITTEFPESIASGSGVSALSPLRSPAVYPIEGGIPGLLFQGSAGGEAGEDVASTLVISAPIESPEAEVVAPQKPHRSYATREERREAYLRRVRERFGLNRAEISRGINASLAVPLEDDILNDLRFVFTPHAKSQLEDPCIVGPKKSREHGLLKRIKLLLADILIGESRGNPEMLKGVLGENEEKIFSRRITDKHRLVYYFAEDKEDDIPDQRQERIVIMSLLSHYGDLKK